MDSCWIGYPGSTKTWIVKVYKEVALIRCYQTKRKKVGEEEEGGVSLFSRMTLTIRYMNGDEKLIQRKVLPFLSLLHFHL